MKISKIDERLEKFLTETWSGIGTQISIKDNKRTNPVLTLKNLTDNQLKERKERVLEIIEKWKLHLDEIDDSLRKL